MTTWITRIIFDYDRQEFQVILPDEFVEHSGWMLGDELEVTAIENQAIVIKKVHS